MNFGEFWLVWDHLFGTYFEPKDSLGEIGVEGDPVPHGCTQQLVYPFRTPPG